MLFALRMILCFFLMILGLHANEDFENKYNKHSKMIKDKNDKIHQLNSKLKIKNLKLSDRKNLQKEKEKLILENFKINIQRKHEQRIARHEHARRNEKLILKYLPNGVCKNPCVVNLEAVVSKKSHSLIGKYIFYIDDRPIESISPKLTTTIYFSKSMLTDNQKKLLSKNIPLHKVFKLRVEGIISETKMLESESKKLVIKSLPSNLTNIELVTNKILPYGKIQIVTSGIGSTELQGTINNIPLRFELDPSFDSSQVLYTIAPYVSAGIYKLSIANFNFNIEIGHVPVVSNAFDYVNSFSTNAVNIGSVITESGRFNSLLGNDGIALFSKFNEVVIAFDNYLKNEATPEEIQEIANIINANALGDSNAYFFVQNERDSIRKFISNINNTKFFLKVISLFIESSYAQEIPQNLFIKFLHSKITEATKFAITVSFNTILDGMINKCYISKGRTVPSYILNSEKIITFTFSMSAGAIIANQVGAVMGYYSTVSAAQALVILIGNDCEGDTTIIPNLVIQSQPIAPIIPGESIDFGVKCDVGDSRYYTPGSILTRVTSKFDYISNELKETGDLIARDKIVHSCSGLGQDAIKDTHNIHCTTNLLEETTYYKNNSSQYETINLSQCSGGKTSYDVGMYQVSEPDFSCNFVNPENNVNIVGKAVIAKQLVFDLSRKIPCPPKPALKAIINYTKTGLKVTFNSTDPSDPDVTGLKYFWDFGDETVKTVLSKEISHLYSEPGTYTVSLVVKDEFGNVAKTAVDIVVTKPILSSQFDVVKSGMKATFTALNYNEALSYVWNFGDEVVVESNGPSIEHVYLVAGFYQASLTVVAQNGNQVSSEKFLVIAEDQIYKLTIDGRYIEFKIAPEFDLSGTDFNFEWNFGDGKILSTQELIVTHTYQDLFAKSASLKIISTDGRVLYRTNITIPDRSNVNLFDYTYSGRNITFSIYDYYNAVNTGNQFYWDFGDGTSLVTKDLKTTHSYPDLTSRTVRLKIKDSTGLILHQSQLELIDRTSSKITINQINRKAKFQLASSIGGVNTDYTFFWNFGDGKSEENNSDTVLHEYELTGSYQVSVNVYDKLGRLLVSETTFILQDQLYISTSGVPVTGPDAVPISEFWSNALKFLRPTTKAGFTYEMTDIEFGVCYTNGMDYFYWDQATNTYGIGTKYVYIQFYNCTIPEQNFN